MVLSLFDVVGVADDFRSHRIELLVGAHGVNGGDGPGDDELGQRKYDTDVERAPDLDLVQVLEICGADRQQEVINIRAWNLIAIFDAKNKVER
jgi:hypothetical protein